MKDDNISPRATSKQSKGQEVKVRELETEEETKKTRKRVDEKSKEEYRVHHCDV